MRIKRSDFDAFVQAGHSGPAQGPAVNVWEGEVPPPEKGHVLPRSYLAYAVYPGTRRDGRVRPPVRSLLSFAGVHPYDHLNIVSFEAMFIGYADAAERFEATAGDRDPIKIFNALFEALNWAVALDERIGCHWVPDGKPLGVKWTEWLGHGAVIMGGVRFARNRVHHQWSDAIVPSGGTTEEFVTWAWRPTDDLPKGRNQSGEGTYREHLEGRPVKVCLDVLGGAFLTLQFMLEPHTIPHADWHDWPVVYDEEAEGYYPFTPALDAP